jgi:hypothetical protein
MSTAAATVLPFRPRAAAAAAFQRERYLVRHEEKTDVSLPERDGKRVVQIKKTFFDGYNRVEFALEKEMTLGDDVDAVVADLELAVSRFFAP